jgi:hypothetical protein
MPVTATVSSVVFARTEETTDVFAGMPVPVTVCPAAIKLFAWDNVTLVVLFKYALASLKTPICENVVPLASPLKTGVLVVWSMLTRF